MIIFNKFVWSKKEPENKRDIWFDGSTWKMYTEEAWQSFTLPVDAADKLAKVLEDVSEVYQEKLNAGYGIVIDGNTISVDDSNVWEAIETLQQNKVEQIQLNDYVPLDRWASTSQVLIENISELNSTKLNKTDVATINGQSLIEGGNIVIDDTEIKPMVSVTYAELVALRDNGELVAGMQYRITDYVTTTAQGNTRSAGHQFDVIVTADNENTLNEVARACLHDGDTYFTEANANLAAWQIWYCLDNDAERFAWADAENGKGVIYRMIDEWNNDCPYDFKNVIYVFKKLFMYNQWGKNSQFIRDASLDKVIEGIQYYGYTTDNMPNAWIEDKCWVTDENVTPETQLYNADGSSISYGGSIFSITNEYSELYTFNEGVLTDISLEGKYCYNNTILRWVGGLNRIAFKVNRTYTVDGEPSPTCYSNSFGSDCHSNTFGSNCHSNIFGIRCHSNTFGDSCISNSFGNDCAFNTLGDLCNSNTFGANCKNNSFGYDCSRNSLGADFSNNRFGSYGSANRFGSNCYGNTFGGSPQNNNFGAFCNGNTLGDSFSDNNFGNNCSSNTFGDLCNSNTLGDNCSANTITFGAEPSGRCVRLKFAAGVSSVTLNNPTVDALYPRDIVVMSGVTGEVHAYYDDKKKGTRLIYVKSDGTIGSRYINEILDVQ